MKSVLFAVCFLPGLVSCDRTKDTYPNAHATAVAVIVDFTDKMKVLPGVNPVLALFNYEQYPEAEGIFHLTAITDKKLNPSYSSYLPDAATTDRLNKDDDAQFRNKAIVAFYGSVKKSFSDAYEQFDTARTMANSECWKAITTELNWLVGRKAENKYLLVASDGIERSDILNAYSALSQKEPKAIADQLQKAFPVPEKLHGITIFFIYQPQTRTEDTRFNKMLEVYKILLEKRGATIKVQATNTRYEP